MGKLTAYQKLSLLSIFVTSVIVLFGWFVWPTPYIIMHEKGKASRLNRFTGIREWSTEEGWMTEERIEANAKTQAEQKAANDRAKLQQLFQDLKQIRVDDSRGDGNKIAILNPTDWELRKDVASYNTTIEYYVKERGQETFICKAERNTYMLKSRTHNDCYLISELGRCGVSNLPDDANVVQKITMEFSRATNIKSATHEDQYINLQPPYELKYERSWITKPRTTDESP